MRPDAHELEALAVARAFTDITAEEVRALPRELVAELFRVIGTEAALRAFDALHAAASERAQARGAELHRAVLEYSAANDAARAARGSPIVGAEPQALADFGRASEQLATATRGHRRAAAQEQRARKRATLLRSVVAAMATAHAARDTDPRTPPRGLPRA